MIDLPLTLPSSVRLGTPDGLCAGVGGPKGLELSSWADKGYHTGLPSTLAFAMSMRTWYTKWQNSTYTRPSVVETKLPSFIVDISSPSSVTVLPRGPVRIISY